jgi:hypothetical protein
MPPTDLHRILRRLFSELTEGTREGHLTFILNSGDGGLLRALDALTAVEASQAVDGGATIAAHAEHLRYLLSLMNRWAIEGGNPFAGATWGEAWTVSAVDEERWQEIRSGLRDEVERWRETLAAPREVTPVELTGMVASVAHLAYHLGAIRQISRRARGPRDAAAE